MSQSDSVLRANRYIFVLLAIVSLLVIMPIFSYTDLTVYVRSALFSGITIACIYASSDNKRNFRIGLFMGITSLVFIWINALTSEGIITPTASLLTLIAFFIYMLFLLAKSIIKAKRISANVIFGAIAMYMIIALIWGFLFSLIHIFNPEAMRLPTAEDPTSQLLYFSFVTITTLGYGDITPVTEFSRSISVILAIIGQMYIAILVAILVGKFLQKSE